MGDTSKDFVDTHCHFWALDKFAYEWPTPDMKIYQDYYPCGLEAGTADTPVKHCVFVQVTIGVPEEADWVIDMASRHPMIKGVVAWFDLTSPKLEESILKIKGSGLLKGARHILEVEAEDWITRDDVSAGLDMLEKHNLTYDLLVRPHHLPYVPQVVAKHPNLKFIINHIAKPPFKTGVLDGWKEFMATIAKFPNVYCKISGLISELEPGTWKQVNLKPYVDHVLDVFTADRCVYGSDWPVFSMVDASYQENFEVIRSLVSDLDQADQQKIFRDNAISFYNLNI